MTLAASKTARIALEWRKLGERLALVRGRVEAMPRAHMDGPLRAAENRFNLRQYDKTVEALDRIDDGLQQYRLTLAEQELKAGAAEQDAHLAAQGVDTERTVSGVGQRHGLLWLIAKKRLNPDRRRAGESWSNDYALIRSDGLRSCLNDNASGGAANDDMASTAAKKITDAKDRLRCARQHITWATGSARLADLLDAVCGRGETLRVLANNDKDRAALLEVELQVALDMAAVSYGVVKIAA